MLARIPNLHDCLAPHADIYSGAKLVTDADVAGFIPTGGFFVGNHKTISAQGVWNSEHGLCQPHFTGAMYRVQIFSSRVSSANENLSMGKWRQKGKI